MNIDTFAVVVFFEIFFYSKNNKTHYRINIFFSEILNKKKPQKMFLRLSEFFFIPINSIIVGCIFLCIYCKDGFDGFLNQSSFLE